tara:strand:- start:365 stop:1006 length:642 start_codon:yes stop_codon:yes gene_type:complete
MTSIPADRPELRFSRDIAAHEEAFFALEDIAMGKMNDLIYGGEVAGEVRDLLYGQGLADFGPPFAFLLLREEEVMGLGSGLPARRAKELRLAGALALARAGTLRREPALARWLRATAQTFFDLQEGDYYLSRVALFPAAQGHGLGRILLDELAEDARRQGCRRVIVETGPTYTKAIQVYERLGYNQLGRASAHDPERDVTLEVLHFGLDLAKS